MDCPPSDHVLTFARIDYVPCSKPLNVSIEIGGVDYAIHPLDMSYISSADPGSGNCVGAWQASDDLGPADL